MKSNTSKKRSNGDSSKIQFEDFRALSVRILHFANRGISRIPFLRAVLNSLLEFSKCSAVELRVNDIDLNYICEIKKQPRKSFRFRTLTGAHEENGDKTDDPFNRLCAIVIEGRLDSSLPFFSRNGSFRINDTTNRDALEPHLESGILPRGLKFDEEYGSIALIPFVLSDENFGLLYLKNREKFFFTENDIETYEGVAQTIGLALSDHRARAECNERVKELTCLYGIARISGEPELSLEKTLMRIARLLPPAWQYPGITTGRITVDGKAYESTGFREGTHKQSADIVVNGELRGTIDVFYLEERPILYEGPFLKEERNLIDTVASEVALIIDRREMDRYKSILQEQLRHADRLATIGQLAAGVAHELNEPIGSALGFAQLAQKSEGIPDQCMDDLGKIVKAMLHAREVVRKLLFFSRQMPANKSLMNLNTLIAEGLYFIESRCAKQQIELVKNLDPDPPEIYADPSQIHQVLVNLLVNSIQVMPGGGRLTISTGKENDGIVLTVEDTGPGMTETVLNHLFVPFFTTKDVGQGTGLGLSVVHGIVISHGGKIEVSTRLGKGSVFKVNLPISGSQNGKEKKSDGGTEE
ncbi:MAG: ATP-binding protein [bacterium]